MKTPASSTFLISENFTNQQWVDLAVINENSDRWDEGIEIIKDRFNSRFFNHLAKIIDAKFSGFIITAVDCLIIETLMQFYLGKNDTTDSFKPQRQAFVIFFLTSTLFKDFKSYEDCEIFYDRVRNGLLHQAQTKKNFRIKIDRSTMLEKQGDIYILDRRLFHSAVENEFSMYIQALKDNGTNYKGENLRLHAISKMQHLTDETI